MNQEDALNMLEVHQLPYFYPAQTNLNINSDNSSEEAIVRIEPSSNAIEKQSYYNLHGVNNSIEKPEF